jgi:ABC-type amino acid transport substrate-binding protein
MRGHPVSRLEGYRPHARHALLAAALALGALTPVRGASPWSPTSGVVRALVAADEAPEMFALVPSTQPGFEREILEGFARLHKVKLEVVPVQGFENIIPALLKGDGDVICGILDTEARRRQVAFTVEILPSRLLAVSRKPKALASVRELAAERVGVVTGTAWGDAATAAGVPAARIESFTDMKALLDGLRSGKVTAGVMSLSDFVLLRGREPDLQAGPFLGEIKTAAWAVRKGDDLLLRGLDEYVENLRRTPSWGRLAVTYFGDDALNLLGRARKE